MVGHVIGIFAGLSIGKSFLSSAIELREKRRIENEKILFEAKMEELNAAIKLLESLGYDKPRQ